MWYFGRLFVPFHPLNPFLVGATPFGEVLGWLKTHAWTACTRQNRFAGSNPVLSAVNTDNQQLTNFTHVNTHTFRGLRAYFFSQYL